MTVNAGTDIIENGLVINYDPANLMSYLNSSSYNNLIQYPEDMSFWTPGPAVNYVSSTLNVIAAPIGSWPSSRDRYLDGKISQFLYYSRALSDTEVMKNFNATRSRFGI